MKKLAIVCSHPVQYHSPIFREITIRDRVTLKVFYTQSIDTAVFDRGFDQEVSWDIPLLEGYNYEFVKSGTGVANQNLVQSIKEWAPNAILVFGWSIPGHLAVMRFFKGRVPVWFRGDSTLLNETFGIRKVIRRLYLTWVYHFVDHAFYVGSNNKEYFLKHGLSENQLSFAPHAIDNERFGGEGMQDYERVAKEWRYSLGIQDNAFDRGNY